MLRYGPLLLVLVWLSATPVWAQEPDPSAKVNRASISLVPAELDFGELLIGESARHTVALVSDGKDEADLELLRLTGDRDFALLEDRCSGKELKPGQKCEFIIVFAPGDTGPRFAELQVMDDDRLLGRLPISGLGVAPMPSQPVIIVSSPLDFGELPVGLQTEQSLPIFNEGGAPLVIGEIGLAVPLSAPFSLTGDLCSGRTLPPGGNCTLRITFMPMTAGVFRQDFDIPSNDPQRNPVLARLQGSAVLPPPVPLPRIRVRDSAPPNDDRHIGFGEVTVGARVEHTITLRNDGDAPLDIGILHDFPLAHPFVINKDDCSGKRLNLGKECQVRILFNPLSAGSFTENLVIPSNDPDGQVIVTLAGSATVLPEPRLAVVDSIPPIDDLSLPFGTVGLGHLVEQTVTLRNVGNAPLRIGAVAAAQNLSHPFAVFAVPCSNRTLQPQEVCTMQITFAPAAEGSFSGAFDIPSNAGEPVIFNVSGAGAAADLPRVTVTDSLPPVDDHRLDFPEVTVGHSAEAIITVANSGNTELRIGQIPALSAPFSLDADQCSKKLLQARESCLLKVIFAPTSSAAFEREFAIPSNDPAGPVTISLIGRATTLPQARLEIVDSIHPTNDLKLPFGIVSNGHVVEQTVTLRNIGNAPLRLGSIAAAQSLDSPFALSADPCSNKILQPQGICTLQITFAPTAAGSFDSAFDIPSDAGEPVIFQVSGTGTTAALPRVTVTDSLPPADDRRLDFAEVTIGRTVEATITVSNSGTAELHIASIPEVPSPFGLSADQCSQAILQAGESCLLLVTFAPTAAASFQGDMVIPSNDAEQPRISLRLAGRGLPAGVNQPPSAPRLLSPGAGQQDLGLLVTLRWEQSSDPDGDAIDYRVRWSTNADLTGAEERRQASATGRLFGAEALLLAGLCGVGALRRSRKILPMLLLTVLLLASLSCSSDTEDRADILSSQLSQLTPATTYYWQIVAEDGRGGSAESEIRSFTTARR